MDLKLKIN